MWVAQCTDRQLDEHHQGQIARRRWFRAGLDGCWAEPQQAEMRRNGEDSEAGAGPGSSHSLPPQTLHRGCH